MSKHTAVFFDLETGGLHVNDPIIEVAAIAVDLATWRQIESFDRRIKIDPALCSPDALRINHYSEERWADSIPVGQFIHEFSELLERNATVRKVSKAGRPYIVARVAGHNVAGFDVERLSRLYKSNQRFFPISFPDTLDTLRLAAWAFFRQDVQPASLSLTALAKHFKYPGDLEKAHTALEDVRMSIHVAMCALDMIKEHWEGGTAA